MEVDSSIRSARCNSGFELGILKEKHSFPGTHLAVELLLAEEIGETMLLRRNMLASALSTSRHGTMLHYGEAIQDADCQVTRTGQDTSKSNEYRGYSFQRCVHRWVTFPCLATVDLTLAVKKILKRRIASSGLR
jgi:hypothetical protein